jgi:hypothetical protein
VEANTIATPATSAFATHTLRPRIRQRLSSLTAVVCWLAASVPAPASDNANAPIVCPAESRFSQRSCSAFGVPDAVDRACSMSSATREFVTTSDTATVALARATASMASV